MLYESVNPDCRQQQCDESEPDKKRCLEAMYARVNGVRRRLSNDEHRLERRILRKHGRRFPQVCGELFQSETSRGDAIDFRGPPVQFNRRPNRVGGAAETRLPEFMADQGQALPPLGFLGRKGASA